MIGVTTLVLEIVGTRLVAPFFGSTIFVWSSLLTATLGGLALGYVIGSFLSRKESHQKLFYFSVFLFGALLIILPAVVSAISSFSEQFGLRFGPLWASAILFLPLFAVAGIAAPLSVKIYSELHPAGVASGRLYALGTFGSLLGALLTGFFLIPLLPISKLLFLSGLVLILPAIFGALLNFYPSKKIVGALFLLFFAGAASFVNFLPTPATASWAKIVDKTTSFYAGLKIIEFGSLRCLLGGLRLYSCIDISSGKAGKDLNSVGEAVNPYVSRVPAGGSALLLGGGGGTFLEALPKSASGAMVELDPAVVSLSEKYLGLDKGRFSILVDDARHAVRSFARQGEKFDLIMMDVLQDTKIPSYVISRESFAELAAILKPDGIILVNGGLSSEKPSPDDKYVSAVLSTGRESFPQAEATWQNDYNSRNIFFYFSRQPLPKSEVPVLASAKGSVLTDDLNPLDYYNLDRQLELTKEFRDFFGEITLQ